MWFRILGLYCVLACFLTYCAVGDTTFLQKLANKSLLASVDKTILDIDFARKNNFHAVEDGELYRSAQMLSRTLRQCIQSFGIKTVVNLRGILRAKKWYKNEKNILEKLKVQYFSISMRSSQLPTKNEVLALLSIYDTAPRPILIHCISGVNRTGMSSALWVLDQQKKSKEEALKQLSGRYGYKKTQFPAKRFFITLWKGREWLQKEYNPANYPRY